jgi:hypothetical protein
VGSAPLSKAFDDVKVECFKTAEKKINKGYEKPIFTPVL